ncbi:MAG: OmpA family protein [Pseudomonadota bacterium]
MGAVRWALWLAVALWPSLASASDLGAPQGAVATADVGPRIEIYDFPTGALGPEPPPILRLRGDVIWHTFRLDDPDASVEAVMQGYRTRVASQGFEILLDCAGRDCGGFDYRFAIGLIPAPAMRMDIEDFAHLSLTDGTDYTTILVSRVLRAIFIQIVTVTPSGEAIEIVEAPKVPAGAEPVQPKTETDRNLLEVLLRDGHVRLADVDFATGGATLAPGSEARLSRVAELLNDRPDLNIVVVGHSDNEGSLDGNIALSRSRAQAVADALARLGVDAPRLEARGIGYLSPITTNDTPEGRAMNRRVELVIRD